MALAPTAQLASGSNLSFTPSNLMCCLEGPSELITAALKRMTKPICPIHSIPSISLEQFSLRSKDFEAIPPHWS